ncbi:MAG: helix-turn-helix domain-containing protein [Phycisphaerales bacterium]
MPRRAIHVVSGLDGWAVMMAPVRFELVEVMRDIAPCSVGELADAVDRPADSIYPHLRQLVRIGVVVEAGSRASRTRPGKVYDLVADDFRPGFQRVGARAKATAIDRTMQGLTRIVSRTSRKAAAAGRFSYDEDFRNVVAKLEQAWLTPRELAAVRSRLQSLKRYLDARKGRRAGELYLAAFFVMPVVRKRGARAARA